MFNTLESHTVNPAEEKKRREAQMKAENDAMAAKVAASLANTNCKSKEDEIQVEEVLEE